MPADGVSHTPPTEAGSTVTLRMTVPHHGAHNKRRAPARGAGHQLECLPRANNACILAPLSDHLAARLLAAAAGGSPLRCCLPAARADAGRPLRGSCVDAQCTAAYGAVNACCTYTVRICWLVCRTTFGAAVLRVAVRRAVAGLTLCGRFALLHALICGWWCS